MLLLYLIQIGIHKMMSKQLQELIESDRHRMFRFIDLLPIKLMKLKCLNEQVKYYFHTIFKNFICLY